LIATSARLSSFWTGKRVLLTGHTGFKGSWLALWLTELGAEVTGYALPPLAAPSLFEQARVDEQLRSVIADIRDADRLATVMTETQPDIVLHLAAQPLVRRSYEVPVETLSVNVLGTAHLLEAVRHAPSVRAVVVVTTDKCYENVETARGYREDDRLGGHDPYSASKACAELVTASYRSSFLAARGTGVASARAGNVIGGGDWATDRIVPDLVRAALAGEPALLRNPGSTRPWQHVLDVLHGYLLLAERLWDARDRFSTAWNFGPSDQDVRTVADVADAIAATWGSGPGWTRDQREHPHEGRALTLDSTKARTKLAWAPRLDFAQAVQWSVDWYKVHRDGGDLRAATVGQIRRFMDAR
jgi:CDP-glucose 4,6-dehydratase